DRVLGLIEVISFFSRTRPSRLGQELCLTRQSDDPGAGEVGSRVYLIPERRRDAEDAHQRAVVLEVVAAVAGGRAGRLDRPRDLSEGARRVLLTARVATETPAASRAAARAWRRTPDA